MTNTLGRDLCVTAQETGGQRGELTFSSLQHQAAELGSELHTWCSFSLSHTDANTSPFKSFSLRIDVGWRGHYFPLVLKKNGHLRLSSKPKGKLLCPRRSIWGNCLSRCRLFSRRDRHGCLTRSRHSGPGPCKFQPQGTLMFLVWSPLETITRRLWLINFEYK